MEILSSLTKITRKQAKRVGRGIGSKKGGHTTGRGAKGDKVRGKTKITFDGTKIKKSWIKRLPFLRGKHRLLPRRKLIVVKLGWINQYFSPKDIIDQVSLKKKLNLSTANQIKILSDGELNKALHFKEVNMSSSAKNKILAAGGKID